VSEPTPSPATAGDGHEATDAITPLVAMSANAGDPVARFLLDHGHLWHGSTLGRSHRGTPQQCYANSWNSVRRSTHLQYCEGWAHPEHFSIAVRHAWIVDSRTNTVIERTWPTGPNAHYLGVVIPRAIAAEAKKRSSPVTLEVLYGEWARDDWLTGTGQLPAIAKYTAEVTATGMRRP